MPHIVYVDVEENVVDEIENVGVCTLWLHGQK